MNLVSTLAAGITAAPLGTAEVYLRGTSTRATVYHTFEGATPDSSGDDLQLDSYGSVEVYVNALVDIIVKNADGTVVRTFTEGHSSPLVEVRSNSFTGINYDTLASAAGNPTTLQSVLDRWFTSAGSIDWKVLVNGMSTNLQNAFGALTGLVFNVKDPTYGAAGDGVTNDQAAIAAALAAAVAVGGGTVFFPPGTYIISTAIEWDHRVNLVGVGASNVVIKTNSAINARILTLTSGTARNAPQLFYGVSFDATQSNTGEQFYSTVAVNAVFVGCEFGATSNCAGNLVRNFTGGGTLAFTNCKFTAYSGYAAYLAANCTLVGCQFVAGVSSYDQELVRVDGVSGLISSSVSFLGCKFDASTVSAAPSSLYGIQIVSTIAYVTVSGCHFVSTGQLFTSAVRFLGTGYAQVHGGSFSGCTTRYSGSSASVPLGVGSHLDTRDRRRSSGSGTAFTVPDCVDLFEVSSTGTVPTITMPAMLYPGQRLTIMLHNTSGSPWGGNVTFTGATLYGSTATNATDGSVVVAEFVLNDLIASGTYAWVGTSVKIGSA